MTSTNKKQWLVLFVSSALAGGASAEVFLSQYVEGSSFNKAIEVANSSDVAVSLTDYQLAKSPNGNGTWNTLDLSSYTIPAKSVLVFANEKASPEILEKSTLATANQVVNFNGDDPIALFKNGQIVDVIGEMGSTFGENKTLVRYANHFQPSSSYQPDQWAVLGSNDITGLGQLEAVTPPVAFQCLEEGNRPLFTAIQTIQGEGGHSPFISGYPYITAESFFVEGVVSAVTTSISKGFYLNALQDDHNELTSNGLFVYTESNHNLKPGDVVCVKGQVQEYYGQTQLKPSQQDWLKQDEQTPPSAVPVVAIASDENFEQTLERYEGMLVALPKNLDMRVTRTFGYDYASRRNNMVLSHERVNPHPNQAFPAGSDGAISQSEENALRRLFVESDQPAPNGVVPYYPDFAKTDIDQDGSTEDYIRINDGLFDIEGVVGYSYGEYRLIATNTITSNNFVRHTPRLAEPNLVDQPWNKADLRVATFNVLNYFNSPFGGDENRFGSNRGANTADEFTAQQEKILQALVRLDADIIGLMEIENNGFGHDGAIAQLVRELNERLDSKKKQYAYVSTDSNDDGVVDKLDSVGTDAITTGVIYRPKSVKLKNVNVFEMPRQVAPEVVDDKGKVIEDGKNYQRDTLAPTFKVKGGKEVLTIAVNHFKSKGSKCWEDAAPESAGGQGGQDVDQQGSCEQFRVAAAVALGDALEAIDGHKMVLGDLNAYGKEDPLLILTDYSTNNYDKVIRAARNTFIGDQQQFGDDGAVITHSYGYINVLGEMHSQGWSYSYNDEVGALDHILISPSLSGKVVDATEWHINAGESTLFDYNDEYKGDLPKYLDHYRSSDHDPAVIDLNINGGSIGTLGLAAMLIIGWRRQQRY
ncbi:nuclease [Vibrio sp. 10N.286.49.C2]|uniref:ExeM/NucH family extracellular endonuclease n=1 Tax=unclassified Vibrio TaxID=2614977 RepID=UPI000C842473|nr:MULTISPECIES: ExeM/NucH family extracellular endonuclease [unclassified Vibrio]PMH37895.1 nuclease [Vibrio sp. 10N.286.49.C2]PMH53173.1 nuclease [Vibrio sp. 10N.286.49.B1]PMH84028.1 nuclease [Vibrio sp. 10N.286.48.B7]